MKYESATALIALFGLTFAAPMPAAKNVFTVPRDLETREVPQEHSHERFLNGVRKNLNLNNPAKIADPVFGLLGNAAAKAGAGSITNLDCLHQATADQAFSNAKAAGNVTGMADALIFAALERNTGGVGTASVICTETAVNPEIAAIQQHQDPASAGAAAHNKAVVLALAKSLASIGADPQDALLSGTFAPGSTSDNTGKGNTCDTLDDAVGCIFTQNLLVEDATAAEIDAAVAGVAVSTAVATSAAAVESASTTAAVEAAVTTAASVDSASVCAAVVTSSITVDAVAAEVTDVAASASVCAAPVTVTITVDAGATAAATVAPVASATSEAAASVTSAAASPAAGTNVQTFTGTLGGAPPPVIKSSGDRPFTVNGNTFVNQGAAIQRSCAIQNNACGNAVNSGKLPGKAVSDCNAQETSCNAATPAKRAKRSLYHV